jgi:hypothetical protein
MSRQPAPESLVPAALPVDHVDDGKDTGSGEEHVEAYVAPASYNEPVVTRRELWSYYRMYPLSLYYISAHVGIVYYNGDNGVGPNGFSMTLFQSLATGAGWDPARGKGSSCLDADASGQCVLSWGSGTKSVSSIVLVANGVSFAVSIFEQTMLIIPLNMFRS